MRFLRFLRRWRRPVSLPPGGEDWARRARLIVPKVGATPLSFPLFFDETHPDLRSAANGGVLETGGDLEFRRVSGGLPAPFGVLHHDAAAGRLAAFVRTVPLSQQTTELSLLAGRAGVDNRNMADAWQDALAGWVPATGADMTAGARALVPTNVVVDAADPWVGVFDGAGSRLDLADASWLSGLGAFSIELLLKADDATSETRILDQGPANIRVRTHGLHVRRAVNGAYGGGTRVYKFALMVDAWSVQIESSEGLWTTGWQHLLFTWARGELPRLYVDGYADSPTFVGRTPVSGTDAPEAGAPVSGVTALPAGSLRIGGSLTGIDWFDGRIALVAVYAGRFQSEQANVLAQNRLASRRGYGMSDFVGVADPDVPVVAIPSSFDQDVNTTVERTAAADDPDGAVSRSVVAVSGTVSSASIAGDRIAVTTGATQGAGEVIWRATQGGRSSDAHMVVRTISPTPPPGDPEILLQHKGAYVGGVICQAHTLRPIYVGIKGTTGTTGRARMAMRFEVPKSGRLVAVAFETRANRPGQADDACSGGYVKSWTDSCTGQVFTAPSAKYCAGGGEYSVGTGGSVKASIHPCLNLGDPNPDNWVPDLGTQLGITARNGGLTRTLVEEFLKHEPYDQWPLVAPVDVTAGQILAVVVQHQCVASGGTVKEKISVNTNNLMGSDPAKRGGPVYGRTWQALWDSLGDNNWKPYKANSSEDNVPMLVLIYEDGDAFGPGWKSAQSASRAAIGGQTRGRLQFRVPSDYPVLTCDAAWAMAFRMKASSSDLTMQVKRADGAVLATAVFPASQFAIGIPNEDSPLDWGGLAVALSNNVTLTPGELYRFEFSCQSYGDWHLQAFDLTLMKGLEAPGIRLVNALPDSKVQISTNGGSSWSSWPGYGESFPAVLRVAATS